MLLTEAGPGITAVAAAPLHLKYFSRFADMDRLWGGTEHPIDPLTWKIRPGLWPASGNGHPHPKGIRICLAAAARRHLETRAVRVSGAGPAPELGAALRMAIVNSHDERLHRSPINSIRRCVPRVGREGPNASGPPSTNALSGFRRTSTLPAARRGSRSNHDRGGGWALLT